MSKPEKMLIASWNVNSLRARIPAVFKWLKKNQPDVLCLQETKCKDEHIPFEEFKALGYEVAHNGINHWNGVAILSKNKLGKISRSFSKPSPLDEPRFIQANYGGIEIINVYVPNGRELDDPHYLYKLKWLKQLHAYLKNKELHKKSCLIMGDFNVAPADIDVYNPARWKNRTHTSVAERKAISKLYELGFIDTARHLNPQNPQYSWWNYRANCFEKNFGLRIDLMLASTKLLPRLKSCEVDIKERGSVRPSDHAPVILELK